MKKMIWSSYINIYVYYWKSISNLSHVIIAKSGGRALASFMNKYNVDNNINRDIFTHLFNICISSILLVKHVALINVMKVIECNIEPCASF